MSFGNCSSPEVTFKWKVINEGRNDILIKQRSGINYILPKLSEPRFGNQATVVVNLEFYAPNRINVNVNDAVTPLDKELFRQLDLELRNIEESNKSWKDYPVDVMLIATISDRTYANLDGGGVESKWLGITIHPHLDELSTKSTDTSAHGTSEINKEITAQFKDEVGELEPILIVGSYIKDSSGKFNDLFTTVYGKNIKIPKRSNSEIPDGLYISYRNSYHTPRLEHIPLEDIDDKCLIKYGLYTCITDAQKGGHTKLIHDYQSKVADYQSKAVEFQSKILILEESICKSIKAHKDEITVISGKLIDSNRATLDVKNQLSWATSTYKHSYATLKDKCSINSGAESIKSAVSIGGLILGAIKILF